jgi:aminopeptidase N
LLVQNAAYLPSTGANLPYENAALSLAHQWAGNSVTPKKWEDLWLGEAFALFLQRKALHGHQPAESNYTSEVAHNGNYSMYQDMKAYGWFNSYSSLHPNIRKDAPFHAYSSVTYEKGW